MNYKKYTLFFYEKNVYTKMRLKIMEKQAKKISVSIQKKTMKIVKSHDFYIFSVRQ